MKLSDKALRLIGLHLLERTDKKTHQDDTERDRNTPPKMSTPSEKPAHNRDSRAGSKPGKAPVLRFPVKEPGTKP